MHGILEAELLPAAYKTKTHIDRKKPSKNNRDEYRAPFFGKMTGILFPMALFIPSLRPPRINGSR